MCGNPSFRSWLNSGVEPSFSKIALPTSPYPQITIASSATRLSSIDSAATDFVDIVTNASDAFAATLPSSGVTAMVISTIAVSNPPKSFGSTSNLSASANTTKANSPPPESKKASFTASYGSNLLGSIHRGTRVAAATVTALSMINDNAPVKTVGS
mmetsp:Transcript_29920/g.62961  ORF Transcript_29920/g.62961 Transcript_29920/m.62961 type:complete len:156 (-) Transcript_29920:1497-1964(-)